MSEKKRIAKEVDAMLAVNLILEDFDVTAQMRILGWLESHYADYHPKENEMICQATEELKRKDIE